MAALNTVGAAVLYLTKFIVAAITATIAAYQITVHIFLYKYIFLDSELEPSMVASRIGFHLCLPNC